MLRCYDSKRQNQEGWSSLHAHFGGKRHRFTTLNHKQKNLQRCRACDCAQKIFDLNKTAEGRLADDELLLFRDEDVKMDYRSITQNWLEVDMGETFRYRSIHSVEGSMIWFEFYRFNW